MEKYLSGNLNFNQVVETREIKNYNGIIHREAVRAVIFINNNILLVQSNRGDYKFPGGGVEEDESHSEGLIREVREETGYINCVVQYKLGIVIERKTDEYDPDALFQMTSHYYLCELPNEEKTHQQLNEYEYGLDFSPKWVTLDEAIKQNENLIAQYENNSWLARETFVLKELKTHWD